MVEQDSEIKDAWGDVNGYLKDFVMDVSVSSTLPDSLIAHTDNTPYHYCIFILYGRTQMHMAGYYRFCEHYQVENNSGCIPGRTTEQQ